MTYTTSPARPAPAPTPPPEAGPEPGEDVGVGYLFRRIYQFFYSKTVGLIIILAMAVLVLLGALIPQAPTGTYADPARHAAFVERAAGKLGGWARVFDALGFFHIFSSPAFLVVTALLAASIIACTAHRIPQLWQRYRKPRVHVTDRFFDKARYRAEFDTGLRPEDVAAQVSEQLRAARYRVISDAVPSAGGAGAPGAVRGFYADKYGWGGFGTVVAHASFVIILVAFAISATGGINDYVTLPVGADATDVGHDTGLAVRATSFALASDEEGRATDYVSHLIVTSNNETVAEQDVRVNEPLRYGGMKFHQTDYGIAVDVLVNDGETEALMSLPLSSSSDGAYYYAQFALTAQQLEVLVIVPGSTSAELEAGQAAFEIYRAGQSEPLTTLTSNQGQVVTLGDLSFTFLREREFTGVTVRHDPGANWMWVGSGLLVIGMMITFTCRHRRLWVRICEGGVVKLASPDKEDSVRRRQFDELAATLSGAFGATVGATQEGTS